MSMAQASTLSRSKTNVADQFSLQLVQEVLERRAKNGNPQGNHQPDYYWAYHFTETKKLDWFLKRSFDITASLLAIIALLPLFLLIALIIRLESKGPILFSQVRVGQRGKTFNMLKFRSMVADAEVRLNDLMAENETEVMFKIKADPRITRVGKIIRKYSLDEFPQLLNVIKGDMSLVGPRPPLPREVAQYQPWHFSRLSTLPGLTGPWQVFGRSNISNFDQVVCLDFQYLENFSFINDLILIARTIPVVIAAKGSY